MMLLAELIETQRLERFPQSGKRGREKNNTSKIGE